MLLRTRRRAGLGRLPLNRRLAAVVAQIVIALVKPQRWHAHFFTGSAPRIAGVEFPLAPKGPGPVIIQFSEPVNLGSVDLSGLLRADGKIGAACLLKGASCATTATQWYSDVAVVQVSYSAKPANVKIALGPSVAGDQKTVGQTAASSLQHDSASGGVSVSFETSKMIEVSGSARWADVVQPPSP